MPPLAWNTKKDMSTSLSEILQEVSSQSKNHQASVQKETVLSAQRSYIQEGMSSKIHSVSQKIPGQAKAVQKIFVSL